MEFTVELRLDRNAKGGVKAWVVDASTEASRSTTHTQRVAFTLKPRNEVTGGGWDIADDGESQTHHFGLAGEAPND